MSYDLRVRFSSWPDDVLGLWSDALAQMGVDAEFHPEFDPVHDDNWCPVVLGFEEDTELPIPKKLRGFGRFETGFEYFPDDSGATFSSKRSDGSLAAFVCGAALAAATGGELSDPQTGESADDATGLGILEQLFGEGAVLEGPLKPTRFRGWGDAEEGENEEDETETEDEEDDDVEEEL